jgi:hypothetical protein
VHKNHSEYLRNRITLNKNFNIQIFFNTFFIELDNLLLEIEDKNSLIDRLLRWRLKFRDPWEEIEEEDKLPNILINQLDYGVHSTKTKKIKKNNCY